MLSPGASARPSASTPRLSAARASPRCSSRVATSGSRTGDGGSSTRCLAGATYFACIEVTSSIDGVTWMAPTQLDSNCCYQPMLSVWVNTRNGHYYYVVDQVNEMTAFVWGHGNLNPDGTITRTLTDAPVGFPGVCGPYITNAISNSVVLDSYQNLFASFETTTGTCPRGYQPGSDTPSYITVLKWT